jgi:hypothetical protein
MHSSIRNKELRSRACRPVHSTRVRREHLDILLNTFRLGQIITIKNLLYGVIASLRVRGRARFLVGRQMTFENILLGILALLGGRK